MRSNYDTKSKSPALKIIGGLTTLALVCTLLVASCTTVRPGYAGILVDQYGSQKGVQDFPLRVGRVWHNPFTQDVYSFPTFRQNIVWEGDEHLTVNSNEGAILHFDVATSFSFVPDSVPKIFIEFRQDVDHITDMFIRQDIRKEFSDEASKTAAVAFFGQGKQTVQDSVLFRVRNRLSRYGILVENIEIVGEVRVDETVKKSINAVLAAAQRAIEAQNKVVQAQAEGEQKVALARAESTSAVVRAAGEAEANRLLQQTVSPLLLEKLKLDKWNGVLPTVQGSSTPMIQLKQ